MMRNDATRLRIATKDPRRPRAVVARQGQVLMDTDFDQQTRHVLDRMETETADVLGSPGRLVVPAGTTSFAIGGTPANPTIGHGHGYLGGWMLENASDCTLKTQPHPRDDTLTPPAFVGLKALIRYVDPVEDPILADVALGDAQASGRAIDDWQVLPFQPVAGGSVSCATASADADWAKLTAPSTGTLAFVPQTAAPSTDPCSLTPGGGYARLENLLYRIEVHDGVGRADYPTVDGPRFGLDGLKLKLSRRNASLIVAVTKISGNDITVEPAAFDPRNWFAAGNWAEIVSIHDDVDPRAALAHERLFRVANATDDVVTLQATGTQIPDTQIVADGTWFLRLWDDFEGTGFATVSASGGAAQSQLIDLGDGLGIQLAGGSAATFRRGDYWTCAARADGSIDWPTGDQETPEGPEVRYATLAAVTPGPPVAFEDCRIPFATLTDRTLLYRGGDGQSLYAPVATTTTLISLPGKLRLAVMRGETPVGNVPVRWSLVTGSPACQLNGQVCDPVTSPEIVTDADGLCEVNWAIDASQQDVINQVQAAIVTGPTTIEVPPLLFTAVFETAAQTSYAPGKCQHLLQVENVQQAIDELCAVIDEGSGDVRSLELERITLLGENTSDTELIREDLILNGLELAPLAFGKGIRFQCDQPIAPNGARPYDPIVEVELDLPYPTTDFDKAYWYSVTKTTDRTALRGPFGFQRVRLDGTVAVAKGGGALTWLPSAEALFTLETSAMHLWGQRIAPIQLTEELLKPAEWGQPKFPRILCRLRLRSALIWAEDKKTGERLYLNAEHLGITGNATRRPLQRGERDPQRAADLDMFIYLAIEKR